MKGQHVTRIAAHRAIRLTLIELLVVIAIIAILAAILFPVFQKVRENARRTLSVQLEAARAWRHPVHAGLRRADAVSAQRGNGANVLGGWMYYSVFGGTTANAFDPTQGSIYSYVKSKGVYVCPDDSVGQEPTGNGFYAMNSCTAITAAPYYPGQKLLRSSTIPSGTMLMAEEFSRAPRDNDANERRLLGFHPGDHASLRHNGGSNFSFHRRPCRNTTLSTLSARQSASGAAENTQFDRKVWTPATRTPA